jgi:hypothetical protein
MKNFFLMIAAVMAMSVLTTTHAAVYISPEQMQQIKPGMEGLSLEAFMNASPKEIEAMTGQKLSFTETIAVKKVQRQLKKAEKSNSQPKSQLIALLLVFFLGYLGIHRFYLGYTTIGILQLLTLGGCGIWALIDLIRIIIGDLGPADGSQYDPKL